MCPSRLKESHSSPPNEPQGLYKQALRLLLFSQPLAHRQLFTGSHHSKLLPPVPRFALPGEPCRTPTGYLTFAGQALSWLSVFLIEARSCQFACCPARRVEGVLGAR